MNISSLRTQLGAIDDGLLTTDRSLQKLETLISQLAGHTEDQQGAQRLLLHFAGMRRRFETLRTSLIDELAQSQGEQSVPRSPENVPTAD
jgi:hypothetical protein